MATKYNQDPNHYLNGNNGLSIAEAHDRVFTRTVAILGDASEDGGLGLQDRLDLWATLYSAVEVGVSRHELYTGAGNVVVDFRTGVTDSARSRAAEFAGRLRDSYGLKALA